MLNAFFYGRLKHTGPGHLAVNAKVYSPKGECEKVSLSFLFNST